MRPQARPIEFQSYGTKEVVNYSAIANKAKQLSDNVRTVAFDQVNDSITFKSSLIHDKPPVSIKPSDNSINNVSSINCTDGSTITGITSDSSNTDPTKAISSLIINDLNERIENLEDKTQNQTATENETTFTGNVTADTFNGFHLGFNNSFYTIPAIPIIGSDLGMEVGRFIDFHKNTNTSTDYAARIYFASTAFHISNSTILDTGDIKARNCISNSGNLNDIVSRTKSLESKNTEQDDRLDALESKDIAHEERLGSIEAVDTAQNETISNINTKNDEQDERLDTIDKTKLTISYPNVNATATVESIDENNNLRTNLRFKINIIFDDPHYIPIFTNESKAIATFRYCYASPDHSGYDKSAVIWANRSNGENVITSDEGTIESYDIRVGAIEIILNITLPYEAYLEEAYDPYYLYWAVSPHPTSDEYIISKNLACDNEERLSSTESKNTEQDTRLDTLEATTIPSITRDISNLKQADTVLHQESVNYYDYSREHIEEIENTTIPAINTKNNEQDSRISKLESKISNLLNSIYPVGSIYLSLTKSPPSLGGTWELIDEGKFLFSTTSTSGETGGSYHHTHATSGHVLTVGEMPMHKHTFNGNKITGTVYDIMKYDTTGQTNKNPEGAFSVNRYGSRTWQGTDGSNRAFSLTFTATPTGSISYEGNNQAHTHGDTEAEYHIPPYITCFMYKRTA